MAHDLIIRGGTVIDGTGAEGVVADLAVDGDRISAIGDLADEQGREERDASGLLVTPGFVDLHTHLDAAVGWDPAMTSSSWHGVTTVLIGNCGVSFAPSAPGRRADLAEMMESVEDIPADAILNGLPWDWETYPEYLDSVQRMAPALNVVGLVGHSALRYHVMGERSLSDEVPSPEEMDQLRELVASSVAGGAVGFSTSRLLDHRVPDGRCVPGTYAEIDELRAMAEGMNDAGGGVFQAVLDFDTKPAHEFGLLEQMAEHAGDVIFSAGPGNVETTPEAVAAYWDAFLSKTRAERGRITAISMTRPSGTLMGLVQVPPVGSRAWAELMALPSLEERLAALRDDATRAKLVADGQHRGLWYDARYVYPLGNGPSPDYSIEVGQSVAELAEAAGSSPVEVVIDRLLASEGRELFNVWFYHRNRSGFPGVLGLEHFYPGASDAGAHAGQICDADAPTHWLSYWVRDRGVVSVAEGIHRITAKAASRLGLKDRGSLRPGAFADLNVIDLECLMPGYPEYVHDLPGGKGRLRVGASGYAATYVNGELVTEEGANTGRRPGRVLRDFARA